MFYEFVSVTASSPDHEGASASRSTFFERHNHLKGLLVAALCQDIETTITESIDKSLREAFEMMAGSVITIKEPCCPVKSPKSVIPSEHAVSVIMGWSGDLHGTLSLTLTDAAARAWTKALIEHDSGEVDQTVIDAVGELGNMVVGGTKRRMCDFNLTMSLPTVVRAGSNSMEFPSSTTALRMVYDYNATDMTILVALVKRS